MLFRSAAVISALAASTVAGYSMIPDDMEIKAGSKFGQMIMGKARALENNQQDASWIANYSIKYHSCSSLIQIGDGEGGNNKDGGSALYTQNLIKFSLCPTNEGCDSCKTGVATYVVNMLDFIDAYTEAKLEEQEYACETVRENCYCADGNDDQYCENLCYTNAGLTDCIEYEGGDDFEIQRYLECAEMEGGNDNNNNNNNNYNYGSSSSSGGIDMYRTYYIGPSCSAKDGKTINMATFFDAGCISKTQTGVYEAFHYGAVLPYETTPIVALNECLSCMKVDENANNNNNNGNNNNGEAPEPSELCEQSYETAAKCESGLSEALGSYYYADTTACDYINNILPKLDKASRSISGSSSEMGASGSAAAISFAVIFALTTAVLAAYSFFLYRKIHRAKVNLAQSDIGVSA